MNQITVNSMLLWDSYLTPQVVMYLNLTSDSDVHRHFYLKVTSWEHYFAASYFWAQAVGQDSPKLWVRCALHNGTVFES